MPSRQDQLHSYQFMIQRVVAALVMRETDPAQSPFRRVAAATLASVMLAALALAAVAVYGVLVGGRGSTWRSGDAVIVDRESSARYVYRDGKLHPVLNYSSALLILGAGQRRTVHVAPESIEGVPRGITLGIPQAPDSLAEASRLTGAPWTLCSAQIGDGQGGSRTQSVLFVGPAPEGAGPAGGRPLGDAGLLARDPTGTVHLLWRNRRHVVREPAVVLGALGWGGQPLTPLAPALVNALPSGGDLARVPVAGRGQQSRRVPGARVGEVFLVERQGGGRQYAVVMPDGLAGLTQVQADLLLGDPDTVSVLRQTEARRLSQGDYALLPKVGELVAGGELGPPASTPQLARAAPSTATCAEVRDATGVAEVRVDVTVPSAPDSTRTGSRTPTGAVLADRVVVVPGRGAVVEAMASPQATAGTLSVLTDLGLRYDVPTAQVLGMLGYAAAKPLRLPAGLVALVPAGPALDPAAARSPA